MTDAWYGDIDLSQNWLRYMYWFVAWYHKWGKISICQLMSLKNTFLITSTSLRGEIVNSWPLEHDDVIKWKHFPRNWPFVRGIHRSPVNSSHKGQWRGALMFSLICVWINDWVNNREAGDLRHYRAHYDVFVMEDLNEIWDKWFSY